MLYGFCQNGWLHGWLQCSTPVNGFALHSVIAKLTYRTTPLLKRGPIAQTNKAPIRTSIVAFSLTHLPSKSQHGLAVFLQVLTRPLTPGPQNSSITTLVLSSTISTLGLALGGGWGQGGVMGSGTVQVDKRDLRSGI